MDNPVVIVGAGPVGLMLAGELGLAGVRAVVLDRLPEPRVAAPGAAVNPATVELLAQRGLMDLLSEDGFAWPSAHFAQLWLDPTRLAEQRAYNFVLPQTKLELRLTQWAAGLGVEVRHDHEVVGLGQDDAGVTLQVVHSGARHEVRAGYVVGADGALSAVRELAGIGFPGSDSPFYGIYGDVEAPGGDPLYQYMGSHESSRGLFTVTPSEDGVVRVSTGEFDVTPPDPHAPVTVEEFRAHAKSVTGAELIAGPTRGLARWHHVNRHADRYREGRVFVAGDAAHMHFPLGGQALSTGIEDAVNLGWKLAAVVLGRAPESLLDSYHAERHPVGARVCLTTRAQVALLHPLDRMGPVRTILSELIRFDPVNEHLVKIAGGLEVRYPLEEVFGGADAHALVGTRPANAALVTAAGETDLARTLHAGRGVLLDLSGDGALKQDAASGWADRVEVVAAEPVAAIDAAAVLLRPDGRVAWASGPGPDLAALYTALRAWFGEPSAV